MEGAVNELVGHDEIGGLVLLLQGSNRRDGKYAFHTKLLEGIDIGAEVEFGREDAMPAAVTSEEGDITALQFAENERIGWVAKRSFDAFFMHIGEAGHGIKPAASDDAYFRLGQRLSPFRRAMAARVFILWQTIQYKGVEQQTGIAAASTNGI